MEEFKQLRRNQGIRDKLSATFNYLRIHYKQLFKTIFVFAGPFLGISLIFMGSSYFQIIRNINADPSFQNPMEGSTGSVILSYIIFMMVNLVIILVTYEYIQISEHKDKNDITLRDVFNAVRKHFLKYFLTLLVLAFFSAAIFLSSAILPQFLSLLLITILTLWLSIKFSITFPIISFEDSNPRGVLYIEAVIWSRAAGGLH